jgi:multidrug efflux pump subunit AcrB
VNATYVGADALTVEQAVATPIEQQMSGVDHMNYMYSLNASNGSMSPALAALLLRPKKESRGPLAVFF